MPSVLRERFWERFALSELTPPEWEALCDGCGRCCVIKLLDDNTEQLHYTSLACRLLDAGSARCRDYGDRFRQVPGCVAVTPEIAGQDWLPATCAYRRLARSQRLPDWHPLLTGDPASVEAAGYSVKGKVTSEQSVHEDDYEDYVVRWLG
ncbi:YcgN family cysteine cluster protein [Isoalcanivorax beigongshangi]|uniref:YcgN family cysteine cluster protein n=1 Tax=Isoalcanivorax beigongshangi TaxID=3238810 RepID=A0ABV4AH66_9GAMM